MRPPFLAVVDGVSERCLVFGTTSLEAVGLLEADGHSPHTATLPKRPLSSYRHSPHAGRAEDTEGLLSFGDTRQHRPLAELSDVAPAADRAAGGPDEDALLLSFDVTIHDSEREVSDGRFARSRRTRAAVARAMLDCLEEGHLRPSARQVAAKAGVSTRAVFRHFDRMEALLEEVASQHIGRIVPQLPPVETEGPLDARVASLVECTTRLNELIEPVRRASMLAEPFSPVIQAAQQMMRRETRRQIRAALAPELEALPEAPRDELVAALRALLSFAYWQELRRYGSQSRAATRRATAQIIGAVLSTAEKR